MPRHRSHSIDFKRQVVAEYHAGETLHALGRRHDLSRNLIRIWVEKAESGSLDQDMASAELLGEYETRIAALERLVGRQALEIEFLILLSHKAAGWCGSEASMVRIQCL
jgi:transposase